MVQILESHRFFIKLVICNSGKDNEVRWFLNINLNKEELSRDIVVTDSLQEGQTLNKDSFYISVDNYLGRSIFITTRL